MLLLLLSPESRGSVKLASSDPFDAPLIDPGYLGTDFDKRILIEATKSIIKFASAPAWSGYILERTGAFADVDVDDEATLLEYITNNSGAGLHAVGTASMSPRGASHGVVDPDLRVKKVDGLRVVDVSVLVRSRARSVEPPVLTLFLTALLSLGPYGGGGIRCWRKGVGSH